MNERVLVGKIQRAILKRYPDAWVFKVVGSPMQQVGVPDVLVCVRGRLVGLEVKHVKPGESDQHARDRASAVQLAQLAAIHRAGGAGGVVLSVEEALAQIEAALR